MDKYNLLDAVAAEVIDLCPEEVWQELAHDLCGDGQERRPAPEVSQTETESRQEPAPEPPPAKPARPLTVPGRPAPAAPRRPGRPAPGPEEPDPFVPGRSPERGDDGPLSYPDWQPLGWPTVREPGEN